MLPDQWYYNKRLIITATLAVVMATVYIGYQHRDYFTSTDQQTKKNSPQVPTNPPLTKTRKFPFMTFLYIQHIHGSENCGGTLIGRRHILTAAHCLDGATNIWMMLGTKNIETEEKSVRRLESNQFLLHESYDKNNFDNDIALIYLNEDVSFNENINKVSLYSDGKLRIDAEVSYVVLGWGLGSSAQGTLLCSLSVQNIESKICATGENGPCHGDSGGPLLRGDVQIGIVSRGDENCYTSVFTNVSFYSDWIKNKMSTSL